MAEPKSTKICEMVGVREYNEGIPVELWLSDATGRLVLVATNEAGFNSVAIDLEDLLIWFAREGAAKLKAHLTSRPNPSDGE